MQVPVGIHDEDLYYLKGPSGAVKMRFLTEGSEQLTKDQWDSISEGMVAMPASAFMDFSNEIGELCSQVSCNYQLIKEALNRVVDKIVFMRGY